MIATLNGKPHAASVGHEQFIAQRRDGRTVVLRLTELANLYREDARQTLAALADLEKAAGELRSANARAEAVLTGVSSDAVASTVLLAEKLEWPDEAAPAFVQARQEKSEDFARPLTETEAWAARSPILPARYSPIAAPAPLTSISMPSVEEMLDHALAAAAMTRSGEPLITPEDTFEVVRREVSTMTTEQMARGFDRLEDTLSEPDPLLVLADDGNPHVDAAPLAVPLSADEDAAQGVSEEMAENVYETLTKSDETKADVNVLLGVLAAGEDAQQEPKPPAKSKPATPIRGPKKHARR